MTLIIKKVDNVWTVNGKKYTELSEDEKEHLNLFFKHLKQSK